MYKIAQISTGDPATRRAMDKLNKTLLRKISEAEQQLELEAQKLDLIAERMVGNLAQAKRGLPDEDPASSKEPKQPPGIPETRRG